MRQSLIVFIALFLCSISTSYAQLPRKGGLGVSMKNAEHNTGIEVIQVIEHTTAASIGLKASDIILSINGKEYANVPGLVADVKQWKEGDKVKVKVRRSNKFRVLKGAVLGKPLETSLHGEVIYGEVNFDGGKLRSILELPNGIKDPPVILLLPGIGCASYDFGNSPDHVVKLLVESFVKEGVAVYRVEKPGISDSQGTTPCLEMDFDYEISAFKAALRALQKIPSIDPQKIYLFGESLGTVTAPYLAESTPVAGIIAWGGLASTWFEYFMNLKRDQKVILGADYEDIDNEFREILPFYYDFLVEKKSPQQLSKVTAYKSLVDKHFKNGIWKNLHHYSYFHTLNDKNILSAYKKVDCPVLALAGEYDIHTSDSTWAIKLSRAVNHYRPNSGSYKILPRTVHHYHTAPSQNEYVQKLKTGQLSSEYMAENFNSSIGPIVAEWIKN